jgi:hypothetical protein
MNLEHRPFVFLHRDSDFFAAFDDKLMDNYIDVMDVTFILV